MAAGVTAGDYIELQSGESIVGLVLLTGDLTYALGTAEGIVKRIAADAFPAKSGNVIIGLKEGDRVVGVCESGDDSDLVFITTDAQLLHFSADNVRPQGAPAGGMAGMRVSEGSSVLSFSAVTGDDIHVATVSASMSTLLATDGGRAKVSLLSDFPAKGRGTGGVRAQTLLKGEDALGVAWVGAGVPRANALDGMPRQLPSELGKRDASGTTLDGDIAFIGFGL
jgi:DNA gyrase subunit A